LEESVLRDYRTWLESELKLLGNASHHAYSLGQANMAKRALERLDQEMRGKVILALEPMRVDAVLTALELLEERDTSLDPALAMLRSELQTARSLGV
jgi:hypothetical protein